MPAVDRGSAQDADQHHRLPRSRRKSSGPKRFEGSGSRLTDRPSGKDGAMISKMRATWPWLQPLQSPPRPATRQPRIVRDVFLALVIGGGVTGCASVPKDIRDAVKLPEARFVQLHLRDVSFEKVTLDFEFSIANPYNLGLTLNGLDYDLDLEGKDFVAGKTNQSLRLEPLKSAPVRLPLTVKFTDFVDNFDSFFSSRETVAYALNAGFGLETPIGPVRVPLNQAGDVPLPKIPDVEMQNVRLRNVGLTGAEVEFSLNVRNRGQFPVQPRGFSYGVKLAGVSVSSRQQALPVLPANTAQPVTIPLRVDFLRLGAAVVEAIRSRSLPYEFKGDLDLGLFKHPFELRGTAKL